MALTSLVSIQVTDFAGDSKTIPVFFAASASLADLTEYVQDVCPLLDAVIDGQITEASVTIAVALPSGLKSSPVDGNTVREGALLGFNANGTIYKHSVYIPSWENGGFASNAVLNTGDYAALIATFPSGAVDDAPFPSDKYANDLTSFVSGKRSFRK